MSTCNRSGVGRRPASFGGRAVRTTLLTLIVCAFVFGCRQDMHDQARYEPLEQSNFFGDNRSERAPVEGTVARGQLRDDDLYYAGKVNGQPATTFPFQITESIVRRGQERYNIYCSPCHDELGNGQGMIVRRGFKKPNSYHIDRLRQAPVGYYFDVITNGFGVMPSYAEQVPAADRWAIIAYIRALQLSQHATIEDVPADQRAELEKRGSK